MRRETRLFIGWAVLIGGTTAFGIPAKELGSVPYTVMASAMLIAGPIIVARGFDKPSTDKWRFRVSRRTKRVGGLALMLCGAAIAGMMFKWGNYPWSEMEAFLAIVSPCLMGVGAAKAFHA